MHPAPWLRRRLLSMVHPNCSVDSWSSTCALGSPVGSTSPERMPCVLQARLGLQRGWRRLRWGRPQPR
jgi:hypothetical protein